MVRKIKKILCFGVCCAIIMLLKGDHSIFNLEKCGMCLHSNGCVRREGFTLIELLVVIAIIALMLAVVMPALNNAKRQASAAVCLSNESQLSKAWHLFATDNNDEIVDGQPEYDLPADGFTDYGASGFAANFTSMPINAANNARDWTLEGRIRGFKKGGLWPYFENYKLYHCPADKRSTKDEINYGYRTYSIGAVYSRLSLSGNWVTGESDVAVTKASQIKNPSSKFVWLEEMDIQSQCNNNTWNHFLIDRKWGDPVAVWHGDSSTFGFADGHAERHIWLGEEAIKRGSFEIALASPGLQKISPTLTNSKDIQDWNWVMRHYVPGNIPARLRLP